MKVTSKILAMMLALALIVCVIPAAFAADETGTYYNPDTPTYDFYSYKMSKTVTATTDDMDDIYYNDGEDLYWYSFNTGDATNAFGEGWVYVETSAKKAGTDEPLSADAKIFVVLVSDSYANGAIYWVNAGDNISTIAGEVGNSENLMIGIGASEDADISVLVSNVYENDAMTPFTCKDTDEFTAWVYRGKTYYYGISNALVGSGVIVESSNPESSSHMAGTTIVIGSNTYVDNDGDGKIKLTLPTTAPGGISFGIQNDYYTTGEYKITFTPGVQQSECEHTKPLTHFEQKDASDCHTNGWYEHWQCPDCGARFSANEAILSNLITEDYYWIIYAPNNSPWGGMFHEIPGQAATCTNPGVADCWYCLACQKYYSDAEGTIEITDRAIPATGHDMTYHAPAAPTCESVGSTGYYTCANEPGVYYKDEAGTIVIEYKDAIIENDPDISKQTHGDGLELVETITPAGCTTPGEGKYTCTCQAAGAEPFTMAIPATGHTMVNGVCSVCNLDENPKTGDMGITLAAVVAMVSMGAVLVIGKKKEF